MKDASKGGCHRTRAGGHACTKLIAIGTATGGWATLSAPGRLCAGSGRGWDHGRGKLLDSLGRRFHAAGLYGAGAGRGGIWVAAAGGGCPLQWCSGLAGAAQAGYRVGRRSSCQYRYSRLAK